MELLPMITKVLVVTGGIFLLTLTISFITSRFRNEKEVSVEAYPAEQYFTSSSQDSNMINYLDDYYHVMQNNYLPQESLENEYYYNVTEEVEDDYYEAPSYNYNLDNEWNEPKATSFFETNYEEYKTPLTGQSFLKRMTVVNDIPEFQFKFGWE